MLFGQTVFEIVEERFWTDTEGSLSASRRSLARPSALRGRALECRDQHQPRNRCAGRTSCFWEYNISSEAPEIGVSRRVICRGVNGHVAERLNVSNAAPNEMNTAPTTRLNHVTTRGLNSTDLAREASSA